MSVIRSEDTEVTCRPVTCDGITAAVGGYAKPPVFPANTRTSYPAPRRMRRMGYPLYTAYGAPAVTCGERKGAANVAVRSAA